jgi:hypothetical protein
VMSIEAVDVLASRVFAKQAEEREMRP